jgi:hypothetical protein
MSKPLKIIISGLLAVPAALITFLGSLFLHLKIYKIIYPNRDTEFGHNLYFDQQVEIHFYIAVPVFYFVFLLLGWHLLNKRDRNA